MQTGKDGEVAYLRGTPGLDLLNSIGPGPIRCLYTATNDVLYMASGNKLYSVDSSFNGTLVGTLQTSTGAVDMADNGIQLFVVDGPNGYWSTLASTALTQVVDINWLGSNRVTFQDGYFIFVVPGTKEFYLSDLNDVTFVSPANTDKNGYPDNLVCQVSVNRNLWLFGEVTTEVWFDSGDNLNPFQYIPGSLMQYGCVAPFSVNVLFNTVFWLGKDRNGSGQVFMASGYQPQRISTHSIETAIQNYPTMSDAFAYSYQEDGHHFYILVFPTAQATWGYDTTTGLWHERAYLKQGQLQRIRQNAYAFAYGKHIVGDYANGNIYLQSSDVFTDNGAYISRQRVSPHLSDNMNRIFYNSFQVDIEAGVGIDGLGQGQTPQAMLTWSDDGGKTWSNEMVAPIGGIGATKTRTIFRRLGSGRNRVFKVVITDPIKIGIMGAELELEQGEY